MNKRNLPFLLGGISIILTLSSIYGIKNLPNSQSLPRPERPAIVSRAQSLEYTIERTRAQDSTNTRAIDHYQRELDSLVASLEFAEQRRLHVKDSTEYETERAIQKSRENKGVYAVGGLLGLGALFGLVGGIMAYVRANRD